MDFNINFNDFSNETNWYLLCFKEFNQIPNTLILHESFIGDKFLSTLNSTEVNTIIEVIPDEDSKIYNQKSLHKIEDGIYVSFLELEKNTDDYFITEVCFYYTNNTNLEKINSLIEKLESTKNELGENESFFNKFNTISISPERLSLEPFLVLDSEIDIEEKYNSSILKDFKKLKRKLKKTSKGLSVFYGDRGLGKTEMMKSLLSELDKMVIFIPSNAIDITINNPEFRNLLQRHSNLIVVIDDCETFSNPQFQRMNYTMNNILQLVDGPLSDSLNLHILMIFNESSMDEIDDNILDSNNLLEIIEFTELDTKLSTELSKTLGFNRKYKTKQRLVDIFSNKKNESKNKIGL
jgi:hypothetical protein